MSLLPISRKAPNLLNIYLYKLSNDELKNMLTTENDKDSFFVVVQESLNLIKSFYTNIKFNQEFENDEGTGEIVLCRTDEMTKKEREKLYCSMVRTSIAINKIFETNYNITGCFNVDGILTDVLENRSLSIGKILCQLSEKGFLKIVKKIIDSEIFNDIPAYDEYGLGRAICFAAQNGHVEIIRMLIGSDRFNEIPADGEYGLGEAISEAAENGHVEIVRMLMESARFNEIPAYDEYLLGGGY